MINRFLTVAAGKQAPGYWAGGSSLGGNAYNFLPSGNVTALALAICDPSLARNPSTVT
jgi:hypothetical protein